jgi:hypothetical protein
MVASENLGTLEKDVQKAIDTLRTLTKAKASHLVGQSQKLPPEELFACAAVAFFQTTKAGFIASLVSGHGFLLKKVHCWHSLSLVARRVSKRLHNNSAFQHTRHRALCPIKP